MVLFVGVEEVKALVQEQGVEKFTAGVRNAIAECFKRWQDFEKSPRHAIYLPEGPIELMPVADDEFYAYKYVNNHVGNNAKGLLSIVGYGALADSVTGYPLMVSEMTILTAIRTAAMSSLVAKYLAKPNSNKFAVIGCGAQSEFQTMAMTERFKIQEVLYYDHDPAAMEKFAKNMQTNQFKLTPLKAAEEALVDDLDVLTICTANATMDPVLKGRLPKGVFINAIGGDSEEKTELVKSELEQCDKIVIEYFDQTIKEGDIKCYSRAEAREKVYAEVWELVQGKKNGRENDDEIILYDSVGFALEDYAVLKYVYGLVKNSHTIRQLDLIPAPEDVKNLFGVVY